MNKITVIGAGLAGCEAAWQIANRGFTVELYEMRPSLLTPAHKTGMLAEIVCSNSLGSENKDERISAAGILKEELEIFNSLILSCAHTSQVPAGGALAVDREKFSSLVTEKITSHKNINLIREEYKSPLTPDPSLLTIIASGPLTSDALAQELKNIAGERIYFYDAVAPVLMKESINFEKVFISGRYGRGDDYINCPLTKEEYLKFYDALINAERNLPHDFEKNKYFEGCMPVEALADRGVDTLRFGPMKPRGLRDPKTDKEPYAAVQLRQDNSDGTLYNIVGFQTGLKWGEQKRVFSMIPGLENAEFVRLGVMHRNTSLNAPAVLDEFLRIKGHENIFTAGQITGVEGYMESTAMGLVAGINAAMLMSGKNLQSWPRESAIGSLLHYLQTTEPKHFQPMNINLGLFSELKGIKGKKERAKIFRDNSVKAMNNFFNSLDKNFMLP
ncbi:MAG: methylenetetrahydrofolate--tRNA-(uracil(54)-C(5))-methyltransferase (FADH(2)-oxidizing) TrmFO [Synergistaceae bacterium]|nr:methylenetetrahydrofolate--tRNA-(uracil(54)-C(5))-methyltransferase (FADH(2)-oxidizing) TrmFO [Synergistaceae bacterium]